MTLPYRNALRTREAMVREVADRLDVPVDWVTEAAPARLPTRSAPSAIGSAGEIAFRAGARVSIRCLPSGELGRAFWSACPRSSSRRPARRARAHLATHFDDPLAALFLPEDDPEHRPRSSPTSPRPRRSDLKRRRRAAHGPPVRAASDRARAATRLEGRRSGAADRADHAPAAVRAGAGRRTGTDRMSEHAFHVERRVRGRTRKSSTPCAPARSKPRSTSGRTSTTRAVSSPPPPRQPPSTRRGRGAPLPALDRPCAAAHARGRGAARQADRAERQHAKNSLIEANLRLVVSIAAISARADAARLDPGRKPRPDPRGREVRLAPRLQVLDLRHVGRIRQAITRRSPTSSHDPIPACIWSSA